MTFDAEFDELASLAYQTAYRILGSRAEAEEIAQDTMVKAYLRWRRVRGHARPWVCRVAANGSLGIVRRRQRGRRHQSDVVAHHAPIPNVIERIDLQRLLAGLSRRQRDVIVLRYLADLSEDDVARDLGISVGSVKTHAHRGLEALRKQLDSTSSVRAPADASPDASNHIDPAVTDPALAAGAAVDSTHDEPKEPTDV